MPPIHSRIIDLIETTKAARDEAIKICKPGVPFYKIGQTIDGIVRPKGYKVVRELTGHGIGKNLHLAPAIRHEDNRDES